MQRRVFLSALALALVAAWSAFAWPPVAAAHGGKLTLRTVSGPYRIEAVVSRVGGTIDETVTITDAATGQPVTAGVVSVTVDDGAGDVHGPFVARGAGGLFEVRYPTPPGGRTWPVTLAVQGPAGSTEVQHPVVAPGSGWDSLVLTLLALLLFVAMPLAAGRWWLRPSSIGRAAAIVALVWVLCLETAGVVQAHRALLIGKEGQDRASATRITDADVAWAVFGQLPPGATQFLSFARPASGQFRARVLVPTQQANLRLNPWIALIGPGLDRPAGLDGLLADGEGAMLVAGPGNREVELAPQIAPFPFLAGASLEVTLPADGLYYLLVFDPSGEGGNYLIDTGYLQD